MSLASPIQLSPWQPRPGERHENTPLRLLRLLDLDMPGGKAGLSKHLQAVLKGCVEWFDASGASIFIKESPTRYVLAAKSGTDSKVPKDARIVPGQGIAGACVASGEPMVIKDPELLPELKAQNLPRKLHIGSAMVIPLVTPDSGCVGVLNLSRKPADPEFGREDLSLARSLAVYLALSVANARLVERLNEALSESQDLRAQIEAVIVSVGVGILALDESGRLLRINPEASGLFASAPKIGCKWSDLRRHAPGQLADAIDHALDGSLQRSTIRIQGKGAEPGKTWTLVAGKMPEGVVVAIQDQSDFERAQEELARVRRLAEIGQMAASIAHEIRNPLTGIRGAAQIIVDDPSQAAEFGKIIEAEVCKLNALCEDFLDFAKPLRLHRAEMLLSSVFQSTAGRLDRAFAERGVILSVESVPNEPTIMGDPLRIEQVAHNLLRNAMEACPSGGKVEVKIGRGMARVRDNGCGMSAETLENLFVPFHTTKPGGTGLGLGVSRRILDAHGASIAVKSRVGKGTEFAIRFPLKEAA